MRAACGKQQGFTLVELMTAVAMLAVLAGVAAPSFRSLIGTMNAKSAAFDLISDLTAARSEAIKRNAQASITPVGGDWAKGWQIEVDGAALRARGAPGTSVGITAPPGGVIFGPSGRLNGLVDAQNLLWTVSSTAPNVTARCIVITPTGAARSKPGGC